jgi:uncharacterized protein (TIGR03083 family)
MMSTAHVPPSTSSLTASALNPESPDVSVLYAYGKEHVLALVRTLRLDQLSADVPSCPGWTVHGVVSHLAGIATDAIEGRLSGIPSDEQTAAQLATRRNTATAVVLREWERSASQFELVLAKMPSAPLPAAVDIAVHEQDIRGAVGLPGHRDNPIIGLSVHRVMNNWMAALDAAGLARPAVFTAAGDLLGGDPQSPIGWTTTPFEIFRTAFGRRNLAQFARDFEGADASMYLDQLVVFAVSAVAIVESPTS